MYISSYLTSPDPDFDRQVAKTREGQANFAGTGPAGATCGACIFLGYWRPIHNKSGDLIGTTKSGGCREFYRLTGKHGPVVPEATEACRYFQRKESASCK